jgi:hypothetical protein
MALVQFGGGITSMTGSHAGNTFARNRGGAYVKAKRTGVNPRSPKQSASRTNLGYLAKVYTHTLTDAQRAQWRTFAATNPVINKVGNTVTLSGQQMFAKLSANIMLTGAPYNASPPASTAVDSPLSLTIAAVSGGGGSLKVTTSKSGSIATEDGILFLSPPLNPGVNFISSKLRLIFGNVITIGGPFDITSAYNTMFGAIPSGPGQRIFMRWAVLNYATGITSAYYAGNALWT